MVWRVLRIIAIVLSIIAIGSVVIGHVGVIVNEGYQAYAAMMSPFNVSNTIVTLIVIGPPLLLYQYANKKINEA